MHAKIRLTASPPASPRVSLSPTKGAARYGRSRSGRLPGGLGPTLPPRSFLHSFACLLLSVLLRRQGVFLLAPLLYISGMLLYVGTVSFEVPVGRGTIAPNRPKPGSIYRSPGVFQHLWPAMQKANSSFGIAAAWQHPKEEEYWFPCINHAKSFKGLQESSGFIVVEANGGLNQQRSSICNAVALAGLLNATLVIPQFHFNSVWQDPSIFGEIYDEDHFINTLSKEVRVVRQLPSYIMESFDNNISNIYNFRSKAWSPASYYLNTVLPRLLEVGVIRIAPFANRLSFDKMPPRIQQLRCFANFEALKFAQPIESTAKLLVDRMIEKSAATGGKYLSIHLRFEEDMVAFSCCVYDGTIEEKREMDFIRERSWRGKFNRTGRIIKPQAIRMDGRCPLTPLEVGMMLRGMGFQSTTPIYLASGKIYKAEKNMAPLHQMFPFLETKETLLSPDELAPFQKFSSRMAALDYTVCLHSEVFVTSQGGNFPQFLMGHRRYLNRGHSKTIKPDKRKLALLLDNPGIRWETFTKEMQWMRRESDAKGHELRKPTASIYITPAPDCMCPFDKSHHTSANLEFKPDSNTTSSRFSLGF